MVNLEDIQPEIYSWLKQVDPNEFVIENLMLSSLDFSSSNASRSHLTAPGMLWISFGIYIYLNHIMDESPNEFNFYVCLWNNIANPKAIDMLDDIELKEAESFDFRKEWALRVMTNTISDFLKTNDLFVINPVIKKIKSIFLFRLSSLKSNNRVEENFMVSSQPDRFLIGFSPVKVLRKTPGVVYLSLSLARDLLTLELPNEQDKIIKTYIGGVNFLYNYLRNLENTFYVFQSLFDLEPRPRPRPGA